MLARWSCIVVFVVGCAGGVRVAVDNEVRSSEFDWPQWQGPDRTAVSKETGLLKAWPKDGPPLLWKATGCGEGFVTPSVANGRIFLMGNMEEKEYVICLSEQNGKHLWKAVVGSVRADGGGYAGPRSTPTVDGEWLYALGLNGDLVCLHVADGKERWRKDIEKDFDGRSGSWGYSESPLVDGDKVVVTPGGKKNTILALDKATGKKSWSAVVPEGDAAAYSSIIAADVDGQRQYIQFLSRGVVGIAAKDGKYLWRFDEPANRTANCSTPIFHNNNVFAASSYSTGGGLAKLTRKDDQTTAEKVYFTDEMQNHHGGMVLVDGFVYGSNEDRVCCLKFDTGEVAWQSKTPGKGSITYADGCLIYRNEGGKVYLFEANPKEYKQLGMFQQPDRSNQRAWAHPVIANGRMYIADQDNLLCYDVKKK